MEHLIYYFLLHINGHLETVGSSRKTQPQHKQTQLREAGDEEIQLETESLLRRELLSLGDLWWPQSINALIYGGLNPLMP